MRRGGGWGERVLSRFTAVSTGLPGCVEIQVGNHDHVDNEKYLDYNLHDFPPSQWLLPRGVQQCQWGEPFHLQQHLVHVRHLSYSYNKYGLKYWCNDPFTRCTIETVYLKNQPQYTELCETKVKIFIEYDEIHPKIVSRKQFSFPGACIVLPWLVDRWEKFRVVTVLIRIL